MMRWKEKKEDLIPPHLPKEVRQKGKGEFFWHSWLSQTLILAVLFGFLSGLVGGMVINARLFDDWFWGKEGGNLVELQRKAARSESRLLARDVLARKAKNIIISFYRQNPSLVKGYLPRPEELVGSGFLVTSDGWLASLGSLIGKFSRKDLVAVDSEKRVFAIEKMVFDSISDLVLVKVNGENFSTLPFIFDDYLETGFSLWLPSLEEGLRPTELILNSQFLPKTKNEFYLSSERLYRFGLLKDNFSRTSIGLPVVTTRGEIAGILNGSASFVRASAIDSALKSVVKLGKARRAYLGAHFVEEEGLISRESSQGVKLANDSFRGTSALDKKSPLAALNLKAGDVILSIGGETITSLHSLPDILIDYAPGAKVEIKYLQEGKEKTATVELGEVIK